MENCGAAPLIWLGGWFCESRHASPSSEPAVSVCSGGRRVIRDSLDVFGQIKAIRPSDGPFLLGYGVFRFAVEFVREPDAHLGFIWLSWMTMGQLLSIPMIAIGIWLLMLRKGPLNARIS